MILVTGATGLLGAYLIEILLNNGYIVKALIRKEEDKKKFEKHSNLLFTIGDVNNLGEAVLDRRDVRNFSGGFRSQSPSNGTNINLASAGIGFLSANARNANRIESKLTANHRCVQPGLVSVISNVKT